MKINAAFLRSIQTVLLAAVSSRALGQHYVGFSFPMTMGLETGDCFPLIAFLAAISGSEISRPVLQTG